MGDTAENIGQRIQLFINHLGISNNKFAHNIGLSGSIVSHMVNGNNFGVDKLINILDKYPELNIEWLILGKGKMLKDRKEEYEREKEETLLMIENKYLKEQLKSKEKELEVQQSLNSALQEIINLLKR